MCGMGTVGALPANSMNATQLTSGAAKSATAVAGVSGGGDLTSAQSVSTTVGGAAGGASDLSAMLAQITSAIEALKQALAGGSLLGNSTQSTIAGGAQNTAQMPVQQGNTPVPSKKEDGKKTDQLGGKDGKDNKDNKCAGMGKGKGKGKKKGKGKGKDKGDVAGQFGGKDQKGGGVFQGQIPAQSQPSKPESTTSTAGLFGSGPPMK